MTHRLQPFPAGARRLRQRGMTLIELLVALGLSLVVLTVIITFYGPASRNRSELESAARMFDNAAYATEVLAEDIRAAGYYGEVSTAGVVWQVPGPCAAGGAGWTAPNQMPAPVIGTAAGVALTGCTVADRRAGTDAITLRRASFIEEARAVATGNGPFLQSSKCADEPLGAPPFIVATGASDFTLSNRGASPGTCGAVAGVRRLLTRTYYVRTTGTTSSLARIDVVDGVEQAPVDVIDNIENVRFQYGFDTNGDGVADRYLPESGVTGTPGDADNRWADVVTVRVYVVARAPQSTPGHADKKQFALPGDDASDPTKLGTASGDNFKRHMKTSLVRVMNTAGRREGS